jgi:hypothetical protein
MPLQKLRPSRAAGCRMANARQASSPGVAVLRPYENTERGGRLGRMGSVATRMCAGRVHAGCSAGFQPANFCAHTESQKRRQDAGATNRWRMGSVVPRLCARHDMPCPYNTVADGQRDAKHVRRARYIVPPTRNSRAADGPVLRIRWYEGTANAGDPGTVRM